MSEKKWISWDNESKSRLMPNSKSVAIKFPFQEATFLQNSNNLRVIMKMRNLDNENGCEPLLPKYLKPVHYQQKSLNN